MAGMLITAYSYTAALIGAGFASGQEILCYFNRFGRMGVLGICTAALAIALFAYMMLYTCSRHHIDSIDRFAADICGVRFGRVLKCAIFVFSFAAFSVMLSAFGSVCRNAFGLNAAPITLAVVLVFAVLLSTGRARLFSANGIMGMVLCTGIIICCLYMLRWREFHTGAFAPRVAADAFTYSGYNVIGTLPLLISMSGRLHGKGASICAAIISGTVIFTMMLLIFALQGIYVNKISLGELPMLTLAARQSAAFAHIYAVLLSLAIITSLISSGAAIAEEVKYRPALYAVFALSYFISGFGFGGLVNVLYRICGIGSIAIIFTAFVKCKNKNKLEYK